MGRRSLMALIVVGALSAVPAGASEELGRGHIAAGGPWTGVCSATVVTDEDSVDGFFLPLRAEHARHHLDARVYRNGLGLPYSLSVNFHGTGRGMCGRNWLGGCTGYLVDERWEIDLDADVGSCLIPTGAVTVEVTSQLGADLDVVVSLLD